MTAVLACQARIRLSRHRSSKSRARPIASAKYGPGLPLTPIALRIVVGGVSPGPRVVRGQIEVCDVLDLTVTIDHNVVDGAPGARFGAELREIIEAAIVLHHLQR